MSEANFELRALLASARALAEELAEEGVDAYAPAAAAESTAAPVVAAKSSTPLGQAASEQGPTAVGADPLPAAAATWSGQPTLGEVRGVLGDCQRCGLAAGRTQIVFGDGNANADILFVGEGPGENEDLQGVPFVGRAGELLTQMIEKGMGLSRADVYICNIVKCRPPNNRNPLPPEVTACRPFLDGQIDAVGPRVIVTLGKPAASLLLGRDVAITRERGTWQAYRGTPLMPTLHPAYVLRRYTPENRRAVWEDLMAALDRSREA